MATQSEGYYTKAWHLFSADKGWIKPLLVIGAANMVPIVGQLGVEGYGLEWARLVAWGADAHPKQKNVQVGACIKSGWRGFLVGIAYAIVLWLIGLLIPGNTDDSGYRLIMGILGIFMGAITSVAAIRSAIYQNFTAGYQVNRIYDMLKRDFGGFVKIICITIVMQLVVWLVLILLAVLMLGSVISALIGIVGMAGVSGHAGYLMVDQVASSLASAIPMLVILWYVASTAMSWTTLMTSAMYGLWMRQFSVPAWGASGDPLPANAATVQEAAPVSPEMPGLPQTSEPHPDDAHNAQNDGAAASDAGASSAAGAGTSAAPEAGGTAPDSDDGSAEQRSDGGTGQGV